MRRRQGSPIAGRERRRQGCRLTHARSRSSGVSAPAPSGSSPDRPRRGCPARVRGARAGRLAARRPLHRGTERRLELEVGKAPLTRLEVRAHLLLRHVLQLAVEVLVERAFSASWHEITPVRLPRPESGAFGASEVPVLDRVLVQRLLQSPAAAEQPALHRAHRARPAAPRSRRRTAPRRPTAPRPCDIPPEGASMARRISSSTKEPKNSPSGSTVFDRRTTPG